MFCNKCGKDNADNAVKCKSCGAPMPAKTLRSGFGDILSYENTSPTTVRKESNAMNNMPVMPPQAPKKSSPLGVIALCLSALALLIAIMAFVMGTSKTGVDEPKNTGKPPVTQESGGTEESKTEKVEETPTEEKTEAAPKEEETTTPTTENSGGGSETQKTPPLQEELDKYAEENDKDEEWSKDALTDKDKLSEFIQIRFEIPAEEKDMIDKIIQYILDNEQLTYGDLNNEVDKLKNEQ